jgi:hypothetical protein
MQLILSTALALLVAGASVHADPAPGAAGGAPVAPDTTRAGAADDTADADAPTVGASLDKSEAHVGDRLTLTISAVAKAGIAVTLPGKLDLGKLELLDRSEDQRDLGDGRRSHRFVLGVSAYDLGELEVPAIELTYLTPRGEARTVSTQPVRLQVKGLVAEDEAKPEVQPLRGTRSAWVENKQLVRIVRLSLVGLAGALALTIAALLVRRALRRRRLEAAEALPAGPRRPPDEVAMEKLRALRAAGNFSVDGYRPFYFALAEIVREYLGARYGFDSLELTTTELVDQLALKASHLSDPLGDVVRFLHDTDLVKFAKAGSTDEAALRSLEAAQAIVLSTAAPLEEVAQTRSGPVLLPRPLRDDEDAHG